MANLIELLLNTPKSKGNHLIKRLDLIEGYNEAEIQEIEKRYNLSIHGQFKEFLMTMGKCSGGLLMGGQIFLYTPKTLQSTLLEDLFGLGKQLQWQQDEELCLLRKNLNDIDFVKMKAFEFGDDGESRNHVYFLLTENKDDILYDWDLEDDTVTPYGTIFDFLYERRKYDTCNPIGNNLEKFKRLTTSYLL